MNSLNQDLARAVVNALASARERRLADQVRHARRVARRAERGRIPGGWLRRRLRQRPAVLELPPVVAPIRLSRARSMAVRTVRLLRRSRPAASLRAAPLVIEQEAETVSELASILGHIAERIVENGTVTESAVLEAMSAASKGACPGAAAALVDWTGSEIARLRAFGIVHAVVLNVLDPCDHSWLLDQVLGRADLENVG